MQSDCNICLDFDLGWECKVCYKLPVTSQHTAHAFLLQYKELISHMCLAGTVVASWSLTQEVAGSSPFTVMTNIFVTEFREFSENI